MQGTKWIKFSGYPGFRNKKAVFTTYELENHVIHLFFYQSLACANKIHFQMRFILMLKDFDLLPNKPAFH